jgi:hypothetical protein
MSEKCGAAEGACWLGDELPHHHDYDGLVRKGWPEGESDPLEVAQEIARLTERYHELTKSTRRVEVWLPNREFLGQPEIWVVLRNYDTHTEVWTLMKSYPDDADNSAITTQAALQDPEGKWWFVFHDFYHTLEQGLQALDTDYSTMNVTKVIL